MNNMKNCIAKEKLEQYGEVFANKGDELIIIEVLEDGRIWCENKKLDKEFAAMKEEILIKG